MRSARVRAPRRLSLADREELSRGLIAGDSLRQIAARLGRAVSTISREVAWNGPRDTYRAWQGEQTAVRRARRPKPEKLATHPRLCREVERRLLERWALTRQLSTLPTELRRTLTWDQGKEMAEHAQFTLDTKITVYFCDPHSPWQRGSNENSNGLLRQYFPKHADLSVYTRAELNAVARQVNNRPRQTLGWMKPSEVFSRFVASFT